MNITTNGIQLHITDHGQGAPALIFLHYWGGSSRTWAPVIAALPEQYRCIAPDLRGWGDSAASPDDAYALADFASDIEALIATLKLQNYLLVGHSMGAKVAQLLASRRPRGLAGVVLVAPAPPTPLAMPPEALAAMAAAYDTPDSVAGAIDHMLTAKPLAPALRAQVIADSLRGAAAAKLAWPTRTSREDLSAAVADINVPVLVIAGELDRVDSVATLRTELLARIPHATLQVLPATGHLSPLESPREIATSIRSFIGTLNH